MLVYEKTNNILLHDEKLFGNIDATLNYYISESLRANRYKNICFDTMKKLTIKTALDSPGGYDTDELDINKCKFYFEKRM